MYSDYKIISDFSIEQFENSVKHYLKEGWQLVAGINVMLYMNNPEGYKHDDGSNMAFYSQAIAK